MIEGERSTLWKRAVPMAANVDADRIRILVVADEEDDHLIIRDLLSKIGGQKFDLDWVDGYDAALAAFERNQYDIYLLYHHLGEHNGLRLLMQMNANGCKAPTILLAAQQDRELGVQAMKAGATDYLVKDQLDAALLERSIRYSIARYRVEDALREAKLQLEAANQTLEERVREHAEELDNANKQILKTREQLVRTTRLAGIGQLAGSVAHDLRNPLAAIRNAAYYLKRRLGSTELAQSSPRIGQFLQILEEEVDHLNEIISDLLAFARANAPSFSRVNPVEVIGSALSSLEVRDNIRIVKRFDPDRAEVLADGEQLYRVFMNLAVNAQDAMPEGGVLTILTQKVERSVEVAFSDTGTGINDVDMKKVFEPLFTTKPKGTGLGLAVCHQIVSQHRGTIDVASVCGEGTTFTITLPLSSDGIEE